MKNKINIFLTIILTFLCLGSSFSKETPAVVRDEKFKPQIVNVELKDLVSSHSFDGKFFKVVLETSDEAISFDIEDEELLLKAGTTYHHLTLARNYFVNVLNSEFVKNMPKIVIRLDIKNKFNRIGHFANVEQDPQFNNAVTVPAGNGYEAADIPPWDVEIWFRPLKSVHVKELQEGLGGNTQVDGIFKQFRTQIHRTNFQRFLVEVLRSDADFLTSVFRTAGSSAILELVYMFRNPINYVFSRKNYFLEAALIPEIIYHEYAHAALSDELSISVSTPINEGMADYFASEIADSSTIAAKIKEYSVFVPKKGEADSIYTPANEQPSYANDDFVFSLLYKAGQEMEKNGEDVPQIFYEARKRFTAGGKIRKEMLEGVLSACRDMCKMPFSTTLKMRKLMNDIGL